ncbi:hypothetical protein EDB85DRAFT_1904595 [Lactarius pseudohatsudake]|nr:hypothetical protein EDB85DRAFT_1904595 [Lactarius pseudohatsudake]
MRCGHGERGCTETVQPRCATRREAGSAWPCATPSRANGAPQVFPRVPRAVKGKVGPEVAWPRGWGGAAKWQGEGPGTTGRGGRHAAHPPSVRMWKGRTEVACPRVPICRVNGAARSREKGREVKGEGEGVACGAPLFCANAKGLGQGWHALAYGGARSRDGRWRRGEGAACPWCAPLPRKRGREGPGVACPCVPLYTARGGKGGTGGKGRGRRHPFRGNGEGRWRGALAQMGREGPGREGEGGGGVPSCAPLLCEWAGAKERDGGTWGKGVPLCAPFLRERGVARLGDKEGAACPRALPLSTREGVAGQCGRGKMRGGITLVHPFSALERGGSQCGGEDEGATYPGAPLSARERGDA